MLAILKYLRHTYFEFENHAEAPKSKHIQFTEIIPQISFSKCNTLDALNCI